MLEAASRHAGGSGKAKCRDFKWSFFACVAREKNTTSMHVFPRQCFLSKSQSVSMQELKVADNTQHDPHRQGN